MKRDCIFFLIHMAGRFGMRKKGTENTQNKQCVGFQRKKTPTIAATILNRSVAAMHPISPRPGKIVRTYLHTNGKKAKQKKKKPSSSLFSVRRCFVPIHTKKNISMLHQIQGVSIRWIEWS
mmetsp:Transcript_6910/g.17336  ORF Transcript_6910/g.17336 Transcript_6910/m.17336 type:complete len:121 (-) Transcript_6910:217-579(-)